MADEVLMSWSETFSNHAALMLEQMNVQRFYSAFCDVSVRVEDVDFRLHKSVLAAASPKLQTLMCGLRDENSNVMTMHDVSLTGFRCILEFIYTGLLKLDIMCVQEVLNTAQFLELRMVEKACLNYLKSVPPSNMSMGDSKSYRGVLPGPPPDVDSHPCYPLPPPPGPPPVIGCLSIPPPPPVPQPMEMMPQENADPASLTPHSEASDNESSQCMSTSGPPQLPMPPLPLPPPPPTGLPPPPISFSTAGSTMDTNYIEDYLKLIESMQGEQMPPQQPHLLPSDMHPPPPYLQQTMSYGPPPPPPNAQYTQLKEMHKPPPPPIGAPLDSLAPASQQQPLPGLAQQNSSRPYRYYNSVNPSTANQYSAEDVRKTILNVLSQEKFDDEEDDITKGDREAKPNMSLTSLLNMAPIHKKVMDANHFEDISEIEDISTNGDDVDVEGEDDASQPDTHLAHDAVSLSHNAASSVTAEEEITVDDFEMVPPPETPDIEVEATDSEEDEDDDDDDDDDDGEEEGEEAEEEEEEVPQLPSSPPQPVDSSNKQKRKKKTPVKLNKEGAVVSPVSGTQAPSGVLQSVIIIANPPNTASTNNIHRDPNMFSKPLKKRIKVRSKRPSYACKTCGREFGKADTLAKHQESHSLAQMQSCQICGQMFPRTSELTLHMRSHSGAIYTCWLCGSQFNTPNMFKQHMLTVHNVKKPFYCTFPQCEYHSHKLSNVERHASIHSERKPFICLQCGKCFAQSNGLRSHLHSCTEQRGYLCDLCGAKFNYLGALKSHRLLHAGKKPYTCADCGASFTDVRNYKRHRRIHDNAFPYPCPHCSKTYRHSNSLKKHLLAHHPDSKEAKESSLPEKETAKNTKKTVTAKKSTIEKINKESSKVADADCDKSQNS